MIEDLVYKILRERFFGVIQENAAISVAREVAAAFDDESKEYRLVFGAPFINDADQQEDNAMYCANREHAEACIAKGFTVETRICTPWETYTTKEEA